MSDEELRRVKQEAEKKIVRNFSLGTRLEIASEDARRISANIKERMKTEGLLPALKWSAEKMGERLKR
jgi:hypothetical protein